MVKERKLTQTIQETVRGMWLFLSRARIPNDFVKILRRRGKRKRCLGRRKTELDKGKLCETRGFTCMHLRWQIKIKKDERQISRWWREKQKVN